MPMPQRSIHANHPDDLLTLCGLPTQDHPTIRLYEATSNKHIVQFCRIVDCLDCQDHPEVRARNVEAALFNESVDP